MKTVVNHERHLWRRYQSMNFEKVGKDFGLGGKRRLTEEEGYQSLMPEQ